MVRDSRKTSLKMNAFLTMHLFLVLFSLQFHEAGWFENVWSVDWLV